MTLLDRMPTSCTLSLPGFEVRFVRTPFRPLDRLGAAVARWYRRWTGRRTIRALTSEQIEDLDLDRLALRREGEKPFWRA